MCRCSCPSAKSAIRTKKPSKVGITLEYQAGALMEKKGTHGLFGASPKNAKR